MNEQNEIRGDEREDVRADLERTEGYEACPIQPVTDEDVEAHFQDWSMRQKHADALRALLTAFKDSGKNFPSPLVKALNGGWHLVFFVGNNGLSVIHHDGSYGLEIAEIVGNTSGWEFADPNPCTQVRGHVKPSEIIEILQNLLAPKQLPG